MRVRIAAVETNVDGWLQEPVGHCRFDKPITLFRFLPTTSISSSSLLPPSVRHRNMQSLPDSIAYLGDDTAVCLCDELSCRSIIMYLFLARAVRREYRGTDLEGE